MNSNQPAVFLSRSDRDYINEFSPGEFDYESEADLEDGKEEEADWLKWSEGSAQANLPLISDGNVADVEGFLTQLVFLHGLAVPSKNLPPAMTIISKSDNAAPDLNGAKINTGANMVSIMSTSQYEEYCQNFNLQQSVDRRICKTVLGVVGHCSSISMASIQVPIRALSVVIDVQILVFDGNVPTPVCTKYMYQ